MDIDAFKKTLLLNEPPAGISIYLQALWFDAKSNWQKAHELIQDSTDKNAYWVHAYLHRKEEDISNADYWYNKAGKQRPACSFADEWEKIVSAFL